MYTNKPRSKDRAYNLKNQSHKTGDNTSIFPDTDFGKKSTTEMTSCSGWKKVRLHGKKPGKNSSKI